MNLRPLLLLALLPVAAGAATYKWKDANGNTHYSEVPPRKGAYETLGSPPPPLAAPNQDAINQSMQQDIKAAPERQQAAAAAAQQQAQKQENCRAAVERIAWLDARQPRRLATTDEAGNVSRMSQEEFDRQRAVEQQKADKNC